MLYSIFKRVFDIVFSAVCLIVFSPLLLIAAIAIKLTSEGPILVEHSDRVGKKGKIFRMYKFRSMVKNAHSRLRSDPKFANLYEQYKKSGFKLEKDPRVTKVGRFLRQTSIDEFPQFFNVIVGDMSFIGPRAYYSDEIEENKKNFPQTVSLINESMQVKPGITGLWQVSGRSKIGFEKRIELDAQYARAKSFWLDLKILLKTPIAVLKRDGVY